MTIAMYIRSPSARLAMRALGPFLMLLFWEIILSRVALPMIPTIKIKQESTALMYLKVDFIFTLIEHLTTVDALVDGCCSLCCFSFWTCCFPWPLFFTLYCKWCKPGSRGWSVLWKPGRSDITRFEKDGSDVGICWQTAGSINDKHQTISSRMNPKGMKEILCPILEPFTESTAATFWWTATSKPLPKFREKSGSSSISRTFCSFKTDSRRSLFGCLDSETCSKVLNSGTPESLLLKVVKLGWEGMWKWSRSSDESPVFGLWRG